MPLHRSLLRLRNKKRHHPNHRNRHQPYENALPHNQALQHSTTCCEPCEHEVPPSRPPVSCAWLLRCHSPPYISKRKRRPTTRPKGGLREKPFWSLLSSSCSFGGCTNNGVNEGLSARQTTLVREERITSPSFVTFAAFCKEVGFRFCVAFAFLAAIDRGMKRAASNRVVYRNEGKLGHL